MVLFPLQRLGTGDDFDQLLGDAGLTRAVVGESEFIDHVARVPGRVVHRGHPRTLLGREGLQHGTIDLDTQVAGQQVGEDFLLVRPDEEEILADLLPRNLGVQVYRAMLETFASEQGARMTAMDNATRNAGDMIDKLTLTYNRARQAGITKELIEIISGAEAL